MREPRRALLTSPRTQPPHRTILLGPATHGRRPRPTTQAPRRARASNPVPATRGRRPRTRAAPHRAAEATHAARWRSSFSSAPPSPASQASCSPAPCCWMGLIRAPRVSCWRHSASHARPLPGIERTVRRQTSQSLRCPPRAGRGTAGARTSLSCDPAMLHIFGRSRHCHERTSCRVGRWSESRLSRSRRPGPPVDHGLDLV